MIGVPMADPRKQIIANLNAQIEHYLATGCRIQDIPPGKSGEVAFTEIGNHPKNLKARRDMHAPKIRRFAAQGMRVSAIATAMGLDRRTVRRIAKENDISLTEPS
jgi:DNA invertase Pin-like site-specific DNA recombinase